MVSRAAPGHHQGMSERKREIKEKLFLGGLVVLVAMIVWVLIINIASRH